jgi:hypothetical protein
MTEFIPGAVWCPSVCSHAHSRRGGCWAEPPSFFVCSVRSAISRNISGLSRHSRGRRISVSATSVAAFGPLAGLSISLIRAKAKDAVGSSRSLYIRRYRCGDLITSMEMASIIALPICDMRRDLRISATSAAVKGARLTAPPMAPASRSGSAPAPARTRCRRAEGATKHQHWGERFGGRMTGRSCGESQDHSTLTSHERAAAHSITSSASTVGRISRPLLANSRPFMPGITTSVNIRSIRVFACPSRSSASFPFEVAATP